MADFESVFNLIPSDKYHSAIITGFSFDFCFFERVILGQLHRAGVTNSLALIDQGMLEESLGRLSGAAKTKSRGYSLAGIRSQGAFHPKIIFLVGESDGLLFVGSGNPTASGFGGNLELWGAISVSDSSDVKVDLFRQTWKFISSYKPFVGGQSAVRFGWIEKYAPWVSTINTTDDPKWIELSSGDRCQFLSTKQGSILKQMQNAIGNEQINKIEIFAPFFDKELMAVKNISTIFNCQNVDIFIQPKTVQFSNEALKQFTTKPNVYDLNQALKFENENIYLHAKGIRLSADQKNYFLLGSANASVAALGDQQFQGINDEACLFLEKKDDFFEGLGFRNGELVHVTDILQSDENTDIDSNSLNRYINLVGLDLYQGIIECSASLNGKRDSSQTTAVRIFDCWGAVIEDIPIDCTAFAEGKSVRLKTRLNKEKSGLYGQIFEVLANKAISNVQLVHEVEDIFRADPDPTNRKLEAALAQLEFGEAGIFDILRTIDLNILIEERTEVLDTKEKGTVGGSADIVEKDSIGGEKLNYEAFVNDKNTNTSANDPTFRKTLPIERIFEVLTKILNQTRQTSVDMQLEEEESEFTTESFDRPEADNNISDVRVESASQIQALKKRIARFMRDYDKKLKIALSDESKALSIAELTRFCVIGQMVIGLAGIRVKEKNSGKSQPVPLVDIFISPFESTCVTGFLFNCVGSFLRLTCAGFDSKNDEFEIERIRGLKEISLYHTLFLLALLPEENFDSEGWYNDRWDSWRWGILQNVIHLLSDQKLDSEKLCTEFEKRRKIFSTASSNEELIQKIIKLYQQYLDFTKGSESIAPKVGARVFFKKYGFVEVKQIEHISSPDNLKISLSGPGFTVDLDRNDFIASSAFVWPTAKIRIYEHE